MTDIDTAAFEAGDAPCNFTAGRVSADGSSTAAHFSDTLGSIYVKAHAELLSARPPAGHTQPVLTVIVEDSADGSSWATVASFAFDGEDDQAAAVNSPRAYLRASWTDVEGTWSVDVGVTSLATASGGGGGSQTFADVLTTGGDPGGNPVTGAMSVQPDVLTDLSDGALHVRSPFNEGDAQGNGLLYIDTADAQRLFEVRDDGTFIYRSGDGNVAVGFRNQDQTRSFNYSSVSGISLVHGGVQYLGVTPTAVGFYGIEPVAQPAAPVTLDDVIAALQALGLVAT